MNGAQINARILAIAVDHCPPDKPELWPAFLQEVFASILTGAVMYMPDEAIVATFADVLKQTRTYDLECKEAVQ